MIARLPRRLRRPTVVVLGFDLITAKLTIPGKPRQTMSTYQVYARILTGPDAGTIVTWKQPKDNLPLGGTCRLPERYGIVHDEPEQVTPA